MAEGDPGNDQPSLELPKLGLRRRKKQKAEATVAPPPPPVEETVVLPVAPSPPPTPPLPTPPPPPPAPELVEPPPLFVDEVEPVTVVDQPPGPVIIEETPPEPTEQAAPSLQEIPVRGPGGMLVAVLTGLVVGLGMVGLTWASLRLCETVQGTSSCGGTGYPLLFAILVLMVIAGTLLLRVGRVTEPGSTSFLAVGLTAVLALLFLVDSLLDTAMIVVIPVITAASYAAAHWVTRTFIEPAQH